MASFKATFNGAGSGDCEVVSCQFSIHQETDAAGRVSSKAKPGSVIVEIIATDSTALAAWAADSYKQESGITIKFDKANEAGVLKTVTIDEAYCVNYVENFSAKGTSTDASMTVRLEITANKINLAGVALDNKWV
ncbi:type VI secretion system tube protein TssD [Hymenobacter weizhouensis]|uniref:type VI secretion system tube protein TssD n=1 Tax=Hymenobacter sp. YIM 151500-1 TaxID=2987689 RepID=UPI002226E457|nr:type VI secretion system tube protein TssD [Hymenobacter sp. YIM 151500-1]UYZ62609.1 hypothetical protein OIS53_16605 [Hymenobacter sp. YIM 151500-1]